jgi:NADH-quinone oxidoreductase subunit C
MTPAELGEAMIGGLGLRCTYTESFGEVTVDVPRERWVQAAAVARDDPRIGCRFFDWLSAVDELDEGLSVFCHLWSVEQRHGLLLRTRVPADHLELDSLTGLYAGAAWHERETYEMFGLVFAGHPHLVPLLLPDGFEGHPLRKDFVLAARVAKVWPGAKEPGESGSGAPSRRRMRPPGVPDTWGPAAAGPEGGEA